MPRPNAPAPPALDLQKILLWAARLLISGQAEDPDGPVHVRVSVPGEARPSARYVSRHPLAADEEPKFARPEHDDMLRHAALVYCSPDEWQILDELREFSLSQRQILQRMKDQSVTRGLLANMVKRGVLVNDRDGYRVADFAMTALFRRHLDEVPPLQINLDK